MSLISVGLNETSISLGYPMPVYWNTKQCAHLLVVGATGSGKSYALFQVLARIGKSISTAQVTVCDFKHDDFRFLEGCTRYYSYTDCQQELDSFYKAFQARQQGTDPSRSFRLLCFDEWAAYVSTLDKKTAEDTKSKLAALLMLGRSFNTHVVICAQRADAQHFSTARDNFSAILAMGNLSDESKTMVIPKEHHKQMLPDRRRGTGYFYSDVTGLQPIVVPSVHNVEGMKRLIIQAVNRE